MHKAILLAAVGLAAGPAWAGDEFAEPLRDLAEGELAAWVADLDLVAAVRAQNAAHRSLSQADIDGLDETWRAEVGSKPAPLIERVLGHPGSLELRARKEASAGLVTEVFVMDSRGLNVVQSDVTSDYWQGDEAKWQETYGAGPGALHISEVEYDESTQTYQSQVSMTVTDPATGEPIGAVTFGIDVGLLP